MYISIAGGAPKTSEYAYFRKVRNAAVHDRSRARHKENEQLKSSKINYLIGGKIFGCNHKCIS